MKCDKLMKEAFEGIEFRYKLDDTLEELGNQKLSSKQLEGFLIGKGVSPKEIKQSGVLKGFEDDNRVMTGKEWLANSGSQVVNTFNVAPYDVGYDTITLNHKGVYNKSYKETLSTVPKPKNNAPSTPHFSDEISTPKESLLGWRRTHTDTINGSKVTVLNELQSDWAQTERAGRGTFESNFENNKQVDKYIVNDMAYDNILYYIEKNDLYTTNPKLAEKLDEAIWINDNEDSTINIKKLVDSLGVEKAKELVHKNTKIVADFPMSEVKHTQYQIVGALDEAIKNGTNKVVIPIERENELMGDPGVTKFYDSLNKKILPEIRKKLEKQGMRIKVGKEEYSESKDLPSVDTLIDKMLPFARDNDYGSMDTIGSKIVDFEIENGLIKSLNDLENWAKEFKYEDMFNDFLSTFGTKNSLHTLTIEEIPGSKVKWDVYALLGGLGLASQTKSEANIRKVNMGTNDNANEATIKQYFADIESGGGNYKAFNKGSKAYGKYQITPIMMNDLGITMKDLNTPAKQEAIMSKLIPKYKSRLEQFNLPVNKENLFVLHNLGMTGGIRVIKGTPTDSDVNNMKYQLHGDIPKSTRNEIINNYNVTYNLDK